MTAVDLLIIVHMLAFKIFTCSAGKLTIIQGRLKLVDHVRWIYKEMATGPWPRVFGHDCRHPSKLRIFPLAAGIAWSSTLTILLARWLALGRPTYPGQVNPEIPFVSDIAAFTLQPVFIAGCAVTGVAFAGTVFAVHHVRYSHDFYGLSDDDAGWRQSVSFVALFMGMFASVCLVCLSIFDTFENNDQHRYILMCTFGGLGLAAILTAVVWWDEAWGPARFAGLRKWWVFFSPVRHRL